MTHRYVFLHGFTQTHHHWHTCAHLLARRLAGEPTLAFVDLPGHGLSVDDRRSIDEAARDVAHTGGPGTYVAYSMGGRFALAALATGVPEIERLVVIGANAGLDDSAERAARYEEDERRAQRVEEIGVEAFVDEWLAMPMFDEVAFSEHDRAHRQRNTAAGLASSLRLAGTGAQRPVWDALADVSVPVLVMAGDRDRKFKEIGLRIAATIPNATFVAIPGAGHAAHTEQPEATAEMIATWLRRDGSDDDEAEHKQGAVDELDLAGGAQDLDQRTA
jgi:2-succinyl-6-hydroxy-2,4-cyclohexadiene-1-carboxylate synthase